MSTEGIEATVRRLIEEGFNEGNTSVLDAVFDPGYVDHRPHPPPRREGVARVKEAYASYRTAFPDGRLTIEDLFSAGDRVVARMSFRGTHLGSFAAVPPTNRPVTMPVVDIWRFADGRIVEGWHLEDDLGLLQQLDVVPAIALTPAEL